MVHGRNRPALTIMLRMEISSSADRREGTDLNTLTDFTKKVLILKIAS